MALKYRRNPGKMGMLAAMNMSHSSPEKVCVIHSTIKNMEKLEKGSWHFLQLPALSSWVIECEGLSVRKMTEDPQQQDKCLKKRNHVKALRAWHKICGLIKQKLTFSLCYVWQNRHSASHHSSNAILLWCMQVEESGWGGRLFSGRRSRGE